MGVLRRLSFHLVQFFLSLFESPRDRNVQESHHASTVIFFRFARARSRWAFDRLFPESPNLDHDSVRRGRVSSGSIVAARRWDTRARPFPSC
jgi:hypothetical protein